MAPPPPPSSSRRKLKKEEMAALLSVLATVVVIVQRFLTDNHLLLPPSQTMALEASVKATTLALSKLQMMCSMAEAVSLAGLEEEGDEDEDEDEGESENESGEDGGGDGNSHNDSNIDSHANGGNVGAPSRAEEEPEGSSAACWFESFLEQQQQGDSGGGGDDDNSEEWRTRFRMSKPLFLSLVEILRPELENEEKLEEEGEAGGEAEEEEREGVVVNVVPVEWKVGAALFRLAHGADFKVTASRFGMGLSSCCRSFYKVCKALQEKLNHVFEFPSSLDGGLATIVDRFSQQGLPNCCAVIACTRFLIHPPLPPPSSSSAILASSSASSSMDYYDLVDGSCSVVMQGVVDSVGRFLDISVGWGGSLSPSDILPRTRLFSRVEETRELLQGPPAELISGVLIPEYIIGDESYPLLPWLLTPYPQPAGASAGTVPPLSPAQLLFNSVHEYVRGAAAAHAFGALKAQWQLLAGHQNADTMELLPFVVAAACILHNFLIDHGEPTPAVSTEEVSSMQPDLLSPHHTHNDNNNNTNRNEYAQNIRDALASHINTVARLQMDFQ